MLDSKVSADVSGKYKQWTLLIAKEESGSGKADNEHIPNIAKW